jgi:hypothetical protein
MCETFSINLDHCKTSCKKRQACLWTHGKSESLNHALLGHAVIVHDSDPPTGTLVHKVGIHVALIWTQRMHIRKNLDSGLQTTVDLHVTATPRNIS